MIKKTELEITKEVSKLHVNTIPGGVLYLIIENDKIIWRQISSKFKLNLFQVGDTIKPASIAKRAMTEKRTLEENIPRALYGIRLKTIAQPIVDENGNISGCYSIIFPCKHPILSSFRDFAPILAEMFNEGAFLYLTDLTQIISTQPSKKFSANLQPGYMLDDSSIAMQAIKGRRPVERTLENSQFGMPVYIACFPMFDAEDTSELVGTFGVIVPKTLAYNLYDMSSNMKDGLNGIISSVQELEDSSLNINENEMTLNKNIGEILQLSEKIDELSNFIKKISNDTNMLGLNAAIEAVRAGEAGKGFSVVASQIRNLSEKSKNTVPQIQKITEDIKAKVKETQDISIKSLNASQNQKGVAEEINKNIQKITSLSSELNTIAQDL